MALTFDHPKKVVNHDPHPWLCHHLEIVVHRDNRETPQQQPFVLAQIFLKSIE
jgi:hypothetical protein